MDLDLRHLRLVAAIADAGTMTRAADRLFLTQSALSHQLRDIETRLGTPLFLRVGRRMVLTAAGRRVLDGARRILADVERVEEDVRRLAGNVEGVIRVSTQCNTGYHWLPPLLKSFDRTYPRVAVHIAVDATDRPVNALLDGEVDLALLSEIPDDRRLRIRPLFRDEMIALAARANPLAQRPWVEAADIAREHLLLYATRPEESFVFREILGPAGLHPAKLSFIMLTEALIELARAGIGVAVLPRWAAGRALSAGGLVAVPITRRGTHRQWVAATLAAQLDPPYLTGFIDLGRPAGPAGPRRA